MTFVWISTWLPSCGKLKFHKKTSTSWRVESIEGCDSSMCDSSGEKGGRKFIYESSWQRPEMAPRLTFCMLTAPKNKPHRRKRRKNLWDQKETTNSQSNYSGLNPCPQLPPPEKSLSVLLIISSGLRPCKEHQPLNPCSPWQRVAMVQEVRAFQLIRNCRWKTWEGEDCGQVPDHQKKGFVYTSFDTVIQRGLCMHPFKKLNDLVIPWSTIGKIQSSLSSKRSGFWCFGKSWNSWMNFQFPCLLMAWTLD